MAYFIDSGKKEYVVAASVIMLDSESASKSSPLMERFVRRNIKNTCYEHGGSSGSLPYLLNKILDGKTSMWSIVKKRYDRHTSLSTERWDEGIKLSSKENIWSFTKLTTKHRNFTKALMHVRYYKLILHQGPIYFPSVKEHSVPKYSMKHAMGATFSSIMKKLW